MIDALEGLVHKPKPPKKMKDMRKHGFSHTVIEHHTDGKSHTVKHHPIVGPEPMSYGAADLEEVHDGLERHLHGEPSKEEMEADE